MVDAELEVTPKPPKPPPAREADVVIVGAGLAGSAAAVVLGRAGYRVVLIDRHAVCPPQFRVEAIDSNQAALFERLGLLDSVAAAATRYENIVNARHGRMIDHTNELHYGLRYEDFVEIVRRQSPATVEFVTGRVTDISTGPERQCVTLAAQGAIAARLVVLATGFGDILREKLGMTSVALFEKHSIPFGFDLAPAPGKRFPFPSLTYYGETAADRVDYLTVFPIDAVMRANLFTFRDDRDPWIRSFRRAPKEVLLATLPGLAKFLGDFEIVSPVQSWVMSLCEVEGHEQQGVVLVGDAFQTSCPAAGTGVTRTLTDVDRLCSLAPAWLASPGMGREKIAQFYADPEKRAADRSSLDRAHNRRRLTVDTSVLGTARRQQHFLRRRLAEWIRGGTGAYARG
jgi:2-polyprenyl-6-methoxyphenol hydroxylase-like FAD-dependent oxidoreductase